MFDAETAKWLVSQGIGVVLAVIIYYQARKDAQEHANIIKSLHEEEKGRTGMLVGVIKDNSVQTNTNTQVLHSLHRRLDKDERDREIRETNGGE